jgi:hypothetical protein
MDDAMQAIEAGTELERRLALFARARLSPDPAATARTKARVMREARLSFEAARIAAHVAPALVASRASFRRRMVMPFLAAGVWVGIAVGSISAAQPGGPLFPTRMWVEAAALPAAPASARTAAELDRLDTRIAEALSGVARSDRAAVAAALDAYAQIADEATTQTAGNAGLEALVAAALDQHRAVLTAVAARLSDKDDTTASDAIELNIERAIEHNAAVMVTLSLDGAAPRDGSGGTGGTGGSTGTGGASGGDTSGRTPEPKATPVVDPTHPTGDVDKPDKTPRSDHTPQTEHSPRD